MEIIDLNSWNDFEKALRTVDEIRTESERCNNRPMDVPLFRGLGNNDWRLTTTLERSYPLELSAEVTDLSTYYRHAFAAKPAIETFAGQDWGEMPDPPSFAGQLETPNEVAPQRFFSRNVPIYRYFVYLRHHGYPSPLLDWTASPYIAAFFAFDSMDKNANKVSIVAIVRDSMILALSGIPQVTLLGPYVRSHRRHMVQQSRYTICTKWVNGLRFSGHDAAIAMKGALGIEGRAVRIDIASSERTAALRSLDLMNINAYSLFGSDDSLIRTIARREGLLNQR